MWSQLVDALASLGPAAFIAVVGGLVLLAVVIACLATAHMKGDNGKGRYFSFSIGNGRVLRLEIDATERAAERLADRPQLPAARKPVPNKSRKRPRGGRGRPNA